MHALLVSVQPGVALRERALAHAAQLDDRRLVAVGEVGIAVAELLGQVEAEAVRELDGARDGVAVVREAVGDVTGCGEHALVVAAPLALAAVERGAAADRDEDVLQRRRDDVVRVRVAGDERRHAQRRREIAQRGVAPRVAALVRPLQLDEEVLASEDVREPRRRVRIADGEPVPRAPGEADEPLVQLLEQRRLERRRQRLASLLRPRPRMRRGEQPAEIRVPLLRLDEQRDVRAAVEGQLRAGDRPDAEALRRVRELERAVDAVVVGERERLVPELRRPRRELLRLRRPVQERVGAVRVQLDVAHPSVLHEHMFPY